MLANCSKIKSYIGFAKKSRNIVFGTDDILKLIKKCQLILISESLSESSTKKIEATAQKFNLKVNILTKEDFFEIIENENIKAIAITDRNLSDAIKIQLDN